MSQVASHACTAAIGNPPDPLRAVLSQALGIVRDARATVMKIRHSVYLDAEPQGNSDAPADTLEQIANTLRDEAQSVLAGLNELDIRVG